MKKKGLILLAALAIVSCDLLFNKDSESFLPANDIEITAIKTPVAKQGEIITVDVTVKNSGIRNANEQIDITLTNQTERVTIGKKTLTDGLASNDSVTVSYTWDTGNLVFGEYILVARHTFKDNNIANDSLISILKVIEPDILDIAISEIQLPDMIVAGEVINVEVEIKNIGNMDLDDAITVNLDDLTDGSPIGTKTINGGLARGDSTSLTYSWDTRGFSVGNHELSASHDFDDGNPANNERVQGITVAESAVPDLAITAIETPSDAMQGKPIEVSVTIQNVGSLDIDDDFQITLQDQTDNKQIAIKTVSGGLNSNNRVIVLFIWDTDQASTGEHTLIARHNFDDGSAANNSRTAKVTINQVMITDIAIVEITGPSSVTQGESAELAIRIKNEGNQDVGSTLTVTLVDQSAGATIGSRSLRNGLNAGATATLILNWNTGAASIGNHELMASHDLDDDKADNDSKSMVVRINEPIFRDIAITGVDAPGSIKSGDKKSIKVTLQNLGNGDVNEAITVTLLDQTDDVTIGTITLDKGIKKGASITLKYNWNTKKVKEGDHRLVVSHNYTDDNAENNAFSFIIAIVDD